MPRSPDSPPQNSPDELRRAVSRWQIVGLSINDVVGSGVYLLPAASAALLGAWSLAAVLLAGVCVGFLVLCFAEAASRFDRAGGAYLYTRSAFGDLVGFEVGWMTWLARVASVASLSVGFAQALTFLWPDAGTGGGRALAIALPLLALTAINLVGVSSGVRTAVALVITKVTPLVILVAVGVFAFDADTFAAQPATRPAGGPFAGFGEAALLLLFAYAGFENTPAPAGEYKNPRRDVPFALLAQITTVTLLYAAVQLVALGTVPDLGSSATPLADAAAGFLGSWGGVMLTVGAALSILGTNSNTVLAGPRYLYALASDGFGPKPLGRALSKVHPRWRTPWVAILVQTAIALPLALSGSFVGLAALSVVARLTTYLGTALAVPVLRRRAVGETVEGRAFRVPGGPVVPALAALLTIGLAASAGWRSLAAAGVALGVGWVLWWSAGRQNFSRRERV
jgi:amino acid transporter